MKHLFTLLILSATLLAGAQTVTTYAGKVNDDPFAKYEVLPSNVDLDASYFSMPEGICFDANGKMYIAERNKIRLVTNNKLFIRGGSLQSPTNSEGFKNGTSTQATFRVPGGMTTDSDANIYIVDTENHAIRKISKFVNTSNNQIITTFAGANPPGTIPGNGVSGTANGTGSAARFNTPKDICVDGDGNMYVTDYLNFTIRKITPAGVVTTLAGSAEVEGTANGTGSAARFGGPWGIAMYDNNSIVVADQWNTNIRMINIYTGVTTTVAGPTTGSDSRIVDGTLADAKFKSPKGIVVVNGIIYVGDQNVIRAIDITNNTVTTFAGDKNTFAVTDGTGSNAAFTEISDIETDGFGNIYIAENSSLVASSVIRKMSINSLAPGADFTVSDRNVKVDVEVTLTDVSTGLTPTDRTWSFDKTTFDILTNTVKDATMGVSFSATGFYAVSLSITNEYGTDEVTKPSYISVSTTGAVQKFDASNLVNVYPNPANTFVKLELDASLNTPNTVVTLFDTHGNVVRILDANEVISTEELASGVYYITVVNADVKIAKKLVIAH